VATEHTATQARPARRAPQPARRAAGPVLRLTGFLKRSWPSLVSVVALIVVWQVVVDARHVSTFTMPSPSEIWQYIIQNATSLRQDTQTTLQETLIAYALSVAIGIPFGLLTYRSRIFARVVYPLLLGSQTFPKVAVGPLFIVWFGFGQLPIVLLALLLTFFPITLNTVAGLRSVEPESIELDLQDRLAAGSAQHLRGTASGYLARCHRGRRRRVPWHGLRSRIPDRQRHGKRGHR